MRSLYATFGGEVQAKSLAGKKKARRLWRESAGRLNHALKVQVCVKLRACLKKPLAAITAIGHDDFGAHTCPAEQILDITVIHTNATM